jgi:hypothetical protein
LKGETYQALANIKGLAKQDPKSISLKEFTTESLAYASATYSIAKVDMYRRTLSNSICESNL